MREPWQRINGVVRAALARVTLADLARPGFPGALFGQLAFAPAALRKPGVE